LAGGDAPLSPDAAQAQFNFEDESCQVSGLAPHLLDAYGIPIDAEDRDWWYLVLNFSTVTQVGDRQRIQSCLRLGKADGSTPIAVPGVCHTEGAVDIRDGVAHFDGGIIVCDDINIGAAGRAIGIPVLGPTKFARSFWVVVEGSLSPAITGQVPLLRYAPIAAKAEFPGMITLNLTPATQAQSEGFAATTSPDGNLQGPGLTIAIRPASPFTGTFSALQSEPEQPSLTYRWLLGSDVIDTQPVSATFTPVGIGESTLYIGGLPNGSKASASAPRFRGALDTIVFDPVSGGRGGG
jgi:hypothetical protein